jgi:hypothetical protein
MEPTVVNIGDFLAKLFDGWRITENSGCEIIDPGSNDTSACPTLSMI